MEATEATSEMEEVNPSHPHGKKEKETWIISFLAS